MSTYEILLLVGSFFGIFAIASFASVILDRGSFKIFVTFALISGASLYVANVESETGVQARDIPPALTKLVGLVRNG